MKTKSNVRLIWTYITIIIIALPITGCVLPLPASFNLGLKHKAYDGPKLPSDQFALLKLDKDKGSWINLYTHYSGIGVNGIDGKKVHYKFGQTIELLPGQHTILFYYSSPLGNVSSDPISKTLLVEAGKKYRARTGYQETSFSSSRMGNTTQYDSSGHWWVEVTEEK
jgi:hypothetical protein